MVCRCRYIFVLSLISASRPETKLAFSALIPIPPGIEIMRRSQLTWLTAPKNGTMTRFLHALDCIARYFGGNGFCRSGNFQGYGYRQGERAPWDRRVE